MTDESAISRVLVLLKEKRENVYPSGASHLYEAIRQVDLLSSVPDLKDQPHDEDGYLEPEYRVPIGYAWSPQTGTVRV